MLTVEEVKKIAALAKIKLTAQEEERHAKTISAVLEYMEILNEVNTDNVEPTFEVNELKNIWREDKIKKCDYGADLVEQFPQKYAGMLVVPGVFDNE